MLRPDVADLIRARLREPSPVPTVLPWRSQGVTVADMAGRANRPGATAADKRAYAFALAVLAAQAVSEIQRLFPAPEIEEDPS